MGFSYGGWMATQAGCARPDVFRAIASAAGGGPQGSCSSPVAAMLMHGRSDDAEPIGSGERSRDHFVESNGCESATAPAQPSPCVSYAGCEPTKDVLWCAFDGVHQVPDFGPAGMWNFFSRLRP
jgi:poly(3-hydroxybutyrate) depolymerase